MYNSTRFVRDHIPAQRSVLSSYHARTHVFSSSLIRLSIPHWPHQPLAQNSLAHEGELRYIGSRSSSHYFIQVKISSMGISDIFGRPLNGTKDMLITHGSFLM
jgi:hypothetical protein